MKELTLNSGNELLSHFRDGYTLRDTHLHNVLLCWPATNNLTHSKTRNVTIDCFSNLQGNLVGFTKHLILKDGSVSGLSGPSDSTESQPVRMINNRFKIWKYGNGRIVSNKRCML